MNTKTAKKVLSLNDKIHISFQEWFDKTYGNTYYSATVYINNEVFEVSQKYGYNAGDRQAINEALTSCGYTLRKNTKNPHRSYDAITSECYNVLKRELHKNTRKL